MALEALICIRSIKVTELLYEYFQEYLETHHYTPDPDPDPD
jgi:hypothetical protein